MSEVITETDGGVVIEVWVVPGSSRDLVGGDHDGALRVRTTALPERGQANAAVARLVAAALDARAANVVSGVSGRRKRVFVADITRAEAEARLGPLTSAI